MKLSEDLRKGAKIRPQIQSQLFGYNEAGELCSCAIGALLEARSLESVTITDLESADIALRKPSPLVLFNDYVINPVTKKRGSINLVVFELNDIENWSREQIADWLESIGY